MAAACQTLFTVHAKVRTRMTEDIIIDILSLVKWVTYRKTKNKKLNPDYHVEGSCKINEIKLVIQLNKWISS